MPRIVQITDLHLRSEPHTVLRGTDVDAGLTAVLAHIREHHWPPDAMLATGDLVHEDDAAYERLRDILGTLGPPVYCLPGNHDKVEAMRRTLRDGPVRWEREILLDGWQLLMLDSTVPESDSGLLTDDELDFLDLRLAAFPDQPALVCVHHHPIPVGSDWLDATMIANAQDLFAVLDRHPRVRGLVWGHVHQLIESRRGGMQLLGTPATCCQFLAAGADHDPDPSRPGYRWLELDTDGTLRSGIERVALP